MKPTHHKKEERVNIDEKIKYARSVFLNARRPHITNYIGYKSGDKHNSRVNSNDKEFIKFTKGNTHQEKKKQNLNNTNHVSYASNTNVSYVSHVSYHELMHHMFSWETNLVELLQCMLGLTTRGQRFMCGCQNVLSLT
jgi:hypothetical protein